jgi:recombination protein RecT
MANQQLPAEGGKPSNKIELLKSTLNAPSVQEQFNNALKEGSSLFVASIIDLFNGDNKLQECSPNAIIFEALKAATLKLPINKSLGFAYIIAYKGKPQFQLGYKGYIQLAMRTGQYRTINADMVYEGELKTVNKLTGEIDFSGQRTSDKVMGYFAHMELLNGFTKTMYMTKEKVTAHAKRYSPSYNFANSPWQTNFDEMAVKTPLKYLLSHYGYLSVEMMNAIANEDEGGQITDDVKDLTGSKKVDIEDVKFEDIQDETGAMASNGNNDPGF